MIDNFTDIINKAAIIFNIILQQHCAREKLHLRIRFKPSLFQHVGKESSLKGKKQNLIVSQSIF